MYTAEFFSLPVYANMTMFMRGAIATIPFVIDAVAVCVDYKSAPSLDGILRCVSLFCTAYIVFDVDGRCLQPCVEASVPGS
jgi:hypothetical protein